MLVSKKYVVDLFLLIITILFPLFLLLRWMNSNDNSKSSPLNHIYFRGSYMTNLFVTAIVCTLHMFAFNKFCRLKKYIWHTYFILCDNQSYFIFLHDFIDKCKDLSNMDSVQWWIILILLKFNKILFLSSNFICYYKIYFSIKNGKGFSYVLLILFVIH